MADNDNNIQEIEIEEEQPLAAASGLGSDAVRKLKVAQVLPFHNATGEFSKSTGGRSRAVRREGKTVSLPTAADLEYLARMQESELRFVDGDELVQAARNKSSSPEVIRLTLIRVAQNAASLEFQRIELQKRGEDTSQLISRHTKVLKEIAALQSDLRQQGQQTLDPRSESFQKVFQLWATNIKSVVEQVMSPEQADLFYTKFMSMMENWEDQAESVLR